MDINGPSEFSRWGRLQCVLMLQEQMDLTNVDSRFYNIHEDAMNETL